ncbi:MAG: substrate-binding domain-containing protein [Firmicutes bacterium]|nr:substrate-binding domain-containing protein [Bacillota bacterium]MBU4553697.1 substrate-binding domain-containing protein [Bacillota bacterium]MBV1728621.1 substrate-binding domain-containing protein [Desulforudis sp.]MBV1769119.1 substrate-binding domain-containing protein [Desulforudis sp.]
MRPCLRLFTVLLAVLIMATGCANRDNQRRPAEEQPKVGFSVADERRDGNQTIKKVVEERSKRDGVRLTWMDAQGDPLKQERDVDKMIEQKMDAVVLQFADPQMGSGLARRLAMNRIKVVALETLPSDAPVDGFIASNHTMAGELSGRYILENAHPGSQGRVLVLSGDPNDPMAQAIVDSLRETLKGTGWSPEVANHPRSDPALAGTTVETALAEGVPDAVLATDSRMIVAAVEGLRPRGLLQRVLTVGVGADRTAAEALVMGEHDAEIDVAPEMLGQFAYEAAVGLAREGRWQYDSQTRNGTSTIPTRITPVRLIQANNAFLLEERYGDLTRMAQQQQGQQGGGGGQGKQQQGGEGGGEQGGGGQSGQQGQQQQQQSMTKLTVTTQDGKTVEIDIPGEVQSIETEQMGGQQDQQGGQGGGGGQGGQGGGSGGGQGGGQGSQ